jgi:P27 family predicted phage terminase small subunit
MRGRKPKPTAAKKLAGNPGKRKLDRSEPAIEPVTSDELAVPVYLSAEAAAEWTRLSCELMASKVLTKVDTGVLALYCQAFGQWVDAQKKLKRGQPVITNSRGDEVVSPWVRISNMAVQQMVKLASELGITPASRSRIKIEPPAEEDPFDEFMKRK